MSADCHGCRSMLMGTHYTWDSVLDEAGIHPAFLLGVRIDTSG